MPLVGSYSQQSRILSCARIIITVVSHSAVQGISLSDPLRGCATLRYEDATTVLLLLDRYLYIQRSGRTNCAINMKNTHNTSQSHKKKSLTNSLEYLISN